MKFPKPVKKRPVRKGVRRISVRRRTLLEEYRQRRLAFLVRHPFCQICPRRDRRPQAATQIHHRNGRVASLLLDERFWLASCQHCHDFIHHNMNAARALGCLCQIGEWNKPVR